MKRLKLLAGVLLFGMIGNGSTRAADPECSFPDDVTYLGRALPQMNSRLSAGGPLTIVALGSSSTAGAGASKPEAAYPARLQEHLASRLRTMVRVVNRGRNGDRIGDMLSRLPADVIPLRPDLVVWQVGTNALLTDLEAKTIGTLFVRGDSRRSNRNRSAIRAQGVAARASRRSCSCYRRSGAPNRRGAFPQVRVDAVLARAASRLRTVSRSGSIAYERLEL
jgi:hypothetical protein